MLAGCEGDEAELEKMKEAHLNEPLAPMLPHTPLSFPARGTSSTPLKPPRNHSHWRSKISEDIAAPSSQMISGLQIRCNAPERATKRPGCCCSGLPAETAKTKEVDHEVCGQTHLALSMARQTYELHLHRLGRARYSEPAQRNEETSRERKKHAATSSLPRHRWQSPLSSHPSQVSQSAHVPNLSAVRV